MLGGKVGLASHGGNKGENVSYGLLGNTRVSQFICKI